MKLSEACTKENLGKMFRVTCYPECPDNISAQYDVLIVKQSNNEIRGVYLGRGGDKVCGKSCDEMYTILHERIYHSNVLDRRGCPDRRTLCRGTGRRKHLQPACYEYDRRRKIGRREGIERRSS